MFDSFLDGTNVNIFVALVAGFITFFASCLLPLVPTYLAYLSGVSLNSEEAESSHFQIMKVAFFFVLGFITTFVIMSLTISALNGFLVPFEYVIGKLAGIVFIILGLFMLGVFKHQIFYQERRFDLRKIFSKNKKVSINSFISKHRNLHALITGIAFGFGWTPCIGPVLAVILYWASNTGSTFNGVMLLIAYGIGLGIPFLMVAAGFEKLIPILKKYAEVSKYVSIISGLVILISGILILIGEFQAISMLVVKIFNLRSSSI